MTTRSFKDGRTKTIEQVLDKKRVLASWYAEDLSGLPVTMQGEDPKCAHSHWMICILVEHAEMRDGLREFLRSRGVETRPLFPPLHLMDMYRRDGVSMPVAEQLASRGVNLPSYPELSRQDVREISGYLHDYHASVRG